MVTNKPVVMAAASSGRINNGTRRSVSTETVKMADEDEKILRDMCTFNGISFEKLSGGAGLRTKQLDMFFFGCSRVVGLSYFTNLRRLCIMNQKIASMIGVGVCHTLEELWICEGEIEIIEDLEGCPSLTDLLLYTNKISRIEGINHLNKLQRLWLNGNKLTKIEGIDSVYEIKDLNLAGNSITKIGQSLSHLKQLEKLDLSGNPIKSLDELSFIYHLPSLRSLSLCHPFYPASPVCQGCNYSSLLLYNMPHLQRLDNRDVVSRDLNSLIMGLVSKKKQYYRIKVHHCKESGVREIEAINRRLSNCKKNTYSCLRVLHCRIIELNGSGDEISNQKLDRLTNQRLQLEQHLSAMEQRCKIEKERVTRKVKETIQRWEAELETGGNVRFTEGSPAHQWYKSCVELVTSRFSSSDFESYGLNGVSVHSVLRVDNRLLTNQFNAAVRGWLERNDEEGEGIKRISYRNCLDYLFLVHESPQQLNVVCRDGFSTLTDNSSRPYVLLTNSIHKAEQNHLSSSSLLPSSPRQGQLLLCKVYVGGDTVNMDTPPTKPRSTITCGYRQLRGGEGALSQGEWYVFDERLVLPEYLVTLDYTPVEEISGEECDFPSFDGSCETEPSPTCHPKLAMLDEIVLLQFTGEQSLQYITTLDLSGNRITRFRLGGYLPLLTSLSLSRNELTTAEGLAHMPHLEKMDISFNNLTSLEGLKSLPKLAVLDISWNDLHHCRPDLFILQRHAQLLKVLNTQYNPWDKSEYLRQFTLGMLRSLHSLDEKEVTEKEMADSIHYIVSTHLSLTSLLTHARTDPEATPSLKLLPIAQHTIKYSCHRPAQLQSNGDWPSQVTAIDLSGLQLHKLTSMDQLTNLRWLCVANNNLTSTEGIESCHKLEELVADNNLLSSLPPLHHHANLTWLSLANNKISTLLLPSYLLTNLFHFNISGNPITALSGVERLSSLVELFASRTLIKDHRTLFTLKSLTGLMILELSFTPVASFSLYRYFTIYHLSSLKMLDAQPIDSNEIALAKEKLGGRLTQDVIFEQFPNEEFGALRTLDFPQCGLKIVDLSPVTAFDNLASLNLEHNSLTSFSGLIQLNKLKVLCLNHNRVDSLQHPRHTLSSHHPPPVLINLQVLHLAYNGISNLIPLQLWRLPSLCALFLQGNEVSRIEGLDGLVRLTELVLDRNKVKALLPNSLTSLSHLRELHLEENRLSDLSFFAHKTLERLYLGMNRIQDHGELDKLCCLPRLIELSLISNPVSRRMQHRSLLIHRLVSLQSLDGVLVTIEERQNAEMTFGEYHAEDDIITEATLPSLQSKVTMPVSFSSSRAVEPRSVQLHTLQAFQDRRKGRR